MKRRESPAVLKSPDNDQLRGKASTLTAQSAIRDPRLDAFRGALLILMLFDHCPTFLRNCKVDYLGYFSVAEGFVYLSGFAVGITQSRLVAARSASEIHSKAMARAFTIYRYHILTFLILYCFLKCFGFEQTQDRWKSWIPVLQENSIVAILSTAALLCQPTHMDVLPMFFLFQLPVCFLVDWMRKGKGQLVLAMSLALWASAQFGLSRNLLSLFPDWLPVCPGAFDLLAWQVLFIGGLFSGQSEFAWAEMSARLRTFALAGGGTVAVLLFALRHSWLASPAILFEIKTLTSKVNLGPLRLLNCVALLLILPCVYHRFTNPPLLSCLGYLGRRSLQVYSVHLLVIFLMHRFMLQSPNWPVLSQILVMAVAIAFLYLAAWTFQSSVKGNWWRNLLVCWFGFRRTRVDTRGREG